MRIRKCCDVVRLFGRRTERIISENLIINMSHVNRNERKRQKVGQIEKDWEPKNVFLFAHITQALHISGGMIFGRFHFISILDMFHVPFYALLQFWIRQIHLPCAQSNFHKNISNSFVLLRKLNRSDLMDLFGLAFSFMFASKTLFPLFCCA